MVPRQIHTMGLTESTPAMDDETANHQIRGYAFNSLANRCVAGGEPRRAIGFYQQALEIARETGDGQGAGEALAGLSQAYTQLGEPRRAIEAYERALGIAREIGGRRYEEPSGVVRTTTGNRRGRAGGRRPVSRQATPTWRRYSKAMAASALIASVGITAMVGFPGGGPESLPVAGKERCAEHGERGAACFVLDLAQVKRVPEAVVPLTAETAPELASVGSSQEIVSASAANRRSEWRLGTPTDPSKIIEIPGLPPRNAELADIEPRRDRVASREFAALVQPEQLRKSAVPVNRPPPTPPPALVPDPISPSAAGSSNETLVGSVAPELAEIDSNYPEPARVIAAADIRYPDVNPDRGAVDFERRSRSRPSGYVPANIQSNRDRLVRSGLLYGTARDHSRRASQGHDSRGASQPRNQLAALGASDVPLVADAMTRGVLTAQSQDETSEAEEDDSRLSDEPSPFLGEGDIPDRPPLLLEIGDPFLDTGELDAGFELPTGAVWQPRLWIFGTQRTAIQTIDTGDEDRISEWVNRLDLFGNLQLTGTEKIVAGIRPWDENQPDDFSGYRFEPIDDKGFRDNLNVDIRTLFAEGDFGSLLPNLDPEGQTLLDFGFTVGRQPLIFQDGILISDTQDTVGLVRNNIRLPGVSNLRIAGIYSSDLFDETTRSAGGVPLVEDENLQLTGLFTEWDTPLTTINADAIYAWDDSQPDGDGFYGGISAAQRLGEINSTFRVNGSLAQNEESVLVRDGILVSSELSWTPYSTNDTLYFNPFVAFGEFLQAAREEIDGGGPLAPLGILFASPNIGEFGSEMSNRANDVVGVAVGYQAFWDDNRRNLAVEIAARHDLGLDDGAVIVTPEAAIISLDGFDQYGAGFQFQQAIGQRAIIQLEGFGVLQEDRNDSYGGRLEFLYQF